MRVLGNFSLSGKAQIEAEEAYDLIYPIYDTTLDLYQPIERPNEIIAMDWDSDDWNARDEMNKAWLRGDGADNWGKLSRVNRGFVHHWRKELLYSARLGIAKRRKDTRIIFQLCWRESVQCITGLES